MKFNKKIVFILILGAGAALAVYFNLRPKAAVYKTAIAARGTITEEISETGTIKKGEEVDLNLKSGGTVANVGVAQGQSVIAGQVLAGLDTRQLEIQLAQANANLALARSQLQKLMNGAGNEDVSIGETGVQNARAALDSAEGGLDDAKINAAQKLAVAFKDASDALSAAYAKAYNANNFAVLVQRTYFAPQNEDSIRVWETTQKMAIAVEKIKMSLDLARANNVNGNFDKILSDSLEQLTAIDNALRSIRALCEEKPWRDTVSEADKNSLDLHRDYIVAAYSSVNSSRQNIILQKTMNEAAVNAAQAAVIAAAGALKTAQDQLGKTSAEPRKEDISAVNAQIDQAEAQVNLLELQIADSWLKSPVGGVVAQVNIEVGETVPLTGLAAVVILPENPYEVEADIYEEDVAKEKVGNKAVITPVSLPDKTYDGTVISIDPVGKMINGVVYYTTKIGFDREPVGLRPEMTADVLILTAQSENAISVPEAAIQKDSQGYYAEVLRNGKAERVAVKIGIKSKGEAEIISGLNEGDEVIIP